MSVDQEKLWAVLEDLGEDEVRKRLAARIHFGASKVPLVEEWLRRQEVARSDASSREQIQIARSAKNAAWMAAIAAIIAAICAIIAIAV